MDASLTHLMGWTENTRGDVPPPLTGPSITISPLPLPHPPTVFLFGGKYVQNRRLTNEMWSMDLSTRIWERVDASRGPSPRYFHSMNVWQDKLVCFGGMTDTEPMSVHDDLWFFDCVSRRWLPPPTPAPGLAQDPDLIPTARYAHLSAVSRGQLVVFGGQQADNSWIYEVNVYDLQRKSWVSKTPQPELQGQHSKGAYRSVATSSKSNVITPNTKAGDLSAHSFSLDEEGEGGDIWCYSNYDFAKVRRELDLIAPASSSAAEDSRSEKYSSPPSFTMRDQSGLMRGYSRPPGLRFPAGGIVGHHFILCGLYLASSSAAFSIWALNLETMAWKHIEPAVLNSGSWNRAVVWPEAAKVLIFGNTSYNLAEDYSHRAVNLDQIAVISLETYGIYCPPRLEVPVKTQELGLAMLDERLASDFEVACIDGRRIKCSRKVLSERWPWFAEQEDALRKTAAGILQDDVALDINDTLLGAFRPAKLATTCLNLPEPFPVCVALLQYFYTLNLATALQNRAPVLSALLFLAKQYRIDRLAKLAVHALHERLEPSLALGIYEIATLSGEQNLQVRALQMIHAAKNSSSFRANRQGPSGIVTAGDDNSSPKSAHPPQALPPPSDPAPPSTTVAAGGAGTSQFRQARVDSPVLPESPTLPASPALPEWDDDGEGGEALLASLTTGDDSDIEAEEPVRRADTATPRSLAKHTRSQLAALAGPLPVSLYPGPAHASLGPLSESGRHPSSPTTSSESTALYPTTPVESVRGFPRVPHPAWMDSRSSSSGHGYGNYATSDSDDHQHGYFDQQPPPPPTFPSPRPKQLSPETASPASPARLAALPSALSSRQAHAINLVQHGAVGVDSLSRYPSTIATGSMRSIETLSLPSETLDALGLTPERGSQRGGATLLKKPLWQMGPRGRSDSSASAALSYRTLGFDMVSSSGSSIDVASISSGSTGGSSKKAMKAERKAIASAEKAARKAQAQAKFEADRAEQLRKQNLSRAEAQRKLDVAKAAKAQDPSADAPEKKSRLGKFGAKFTEAVLFPSGGEKSTMF